MRELIVGQSVGYVYKTVYMHAYSAVVVVVAVVTVVVLSPKISSETEKGSIITDTTCFASPTTTC